MLENPVSGRAVGATLVDMRELDGYNIDNLGNWSMTTRRKDYSSQLPMKVMRVMAGYPEKKDCPFITKKEDLNMTNLSEPVDDRWTISGRE